MATRCGTFNGDTSTIHVHLSVADLIEPRPSKQDISRRRGVLRDREVVGGCERTSTDHGFDDFPRLTVVVRERYLAGTSIVSCASFDGHLALSASFVCRFGHVRSFLLVVALAGEV